MLGWLPVYALLYAAGLFSKTNITVKSLYRPLVERDAHATARSILRNLCFSRLLILGMTDFLEVSLAAGSCFGMVASALRTLSLIDGSALPPSFLSNSIV